MGNYKNQNRIEKLSKKTGNTSTRLSDQRKILFGGRGTDFDELSYLRSWGNDSDTVNRTLKDAWVKYGKSHGMPGNRSGQIEKDFYKNSNFYNATVLDRVRGWNYSSNYLGGSSTNAWNIEPEQLPFDATDIRDAGIHAYSIYVTDTNVSAQLDSMDDILEVDPSAIFIIKDFVTYDTDYSVATGGANRTSKINDFVAIVAGFKGRTEVKGIMFANENNLAGNRSDGTTVADWYSLVDAAIVAGKAEDNSGIDRVYGTIDADLGTYPGDASLPNLDVLWLNIYRGTTFTDLASDILAATSKPVFLSEFGRQRANNTDPEQVDQAAEVVSLIEEAEAMYPIIRGWVHFKFTHTADADYWEATAPLADGTHEARTKFDLYDSIKSYCTTNLYGRG